MLKKSLIAIAVVALIAATAQAGIVFDEDDPDVSYKEDGKWPSEYIEVDICTIDVYMDVGYYVTIEDCDKLEITLKQVTCGDFPSSWDVDDDDFPCYEGCVRVDGKSDKEYFKARSNFDAIFGADLEEIGDILDKTKIYWVDDLKTIDGDGEWHKLTVCIGAWKTDIYEAGPDNEVKVGELTITVKPQSWE